MTNEGQFRKKMDVILAYAMASNRVITNEDLMGFFNDQILSPGQLDQIYDHLEKNGVDIVRADDEEIDLLTEELFEDTISEEEIEPSEDSFDVTDPTDVSDPVKQYLKEIGKIPLLSSEEEIEVEIIRVPEYKEELTVTTSVYGMKPMFGFRNTVDGSYLVFE